MILLSSRVKTRPRLKVKKRTPQTKDVMETSSKEASGVGDQSLSYDNVGEKIEDQNKLDEEKR